MREGGRDGWHTVGLGMEVLVVVQEVDEVSTLALTGAYQGQAYGDPLKELMTITR